MTFKEFTQAIKKDDRLMELLNHCDRSCEPLTDAETQELIDRCEAACDDWEDPLEFESPVDLYGVHWE